MGADDHSEYGPTWYSGVMTLPPPRPPLGFDCDVDVCVIGGGVAGLTVARELARRGWSVAVLEARRVGGMASGRNSGFVLPGFSARIEKVVERIGLPAAKELWALSEAGVRHVRDTIAEIGGSGIMEGEGWLDVFRTQDAEAMFARLGLLGQEFGTDVEGWPIERVRHVLKTNHYFHAIHVPGAFHINPLAYVLGLAAAAERAGARVFEHTAALAVDPAGVRKRIITPRGRVRAAHVVLAGSIYLGAVAPRLADTLIPVTAYTGVTKPLGARLAFAVTFAGAVSDSRHASRHYRIVGGDRLMWTGTPFALSPHAGAIKQRFERTLGAIYPQLGRVEFEHFWPADMGFALHRMPQVGDVQPGVWLVSGFGSRGLDTSAIAGQLVARAIVDGDDTFRRFLPFPLVWAGGRIGRAAVRASAWWRDRSEAVNALLARRREEAGLHHTRSQHAYRDVDAATGPRQPFAAPADLRVDPPDAVPDVADAPSPGFKAPPST